LWCRFIDKEWLCLSLVHLRRVLEHVSWLACSHTINSLLCFRSNNINSIKVFRYHIRYVFIVWEHLLHWRRVFSWVHRSWSLLKAHHLNTSIDVLSWPKIQLIHLMIKPLRIRIWLKPLFNNFILFFLGFSLAAHNWRSRALILLKLLWDSLNMSWNILIEDFSMLF
jgi:hypothetical protein